MNKIEEVRPLRLERDMAALKYAEIDQSFLLFTYEGETSWDAGPKEQHRGNISGAICIYIWGLGQMIDNVLHDFGTGFVLYKPEYNSYS